MVDEPHRGIASAIAFGVAAISAVVTTVFLVKGNEPAAVGVTATGSSASVGVSGRF